MEGGGGVCLRKEKKKEGKENEKKRRQVEGIMETDCKRMLTTVSFIVAGEAGGNERWWDGEEQADDAGCSGMVV